MKSEGQFGLSKKDKRQLSPFFAQELGYDYLKNALDPQRKAAFEAEMARDPQVHNDLEGIRWAMHYTEQLSKTTISKAVFEEIDEPETYLSTLLQKTNYSHWPLTVKWAVEVMIVLAAFLLILIVIPWDQALKFGLSPHQREIILAEVIHPRADNEHRDKDEAANEAPETTAPPASTEVAEQKTAATAAKVDTKNLEKLTNVTLPPLPVAAPPPAEKPVAAATDTQADATATAAPKPYPGTKAKPTEGFLYRGSLSVANLQVVGPKIRDKILELGGHKAGGVDLGWQKTRNSAYFHFTLPEEHYEEFLSFLEDFGTAKLTKEKHSRIMPQGLVRLIITVEETEKP